MPRQGYDCPSHGEFEVNIPVGEDVPKTQPCPKECVNPPCKHQCYNRFCAWVPSVPNFIGGPTTGAKKE